MRKCPETFIGVSGRFRFFSAARKYDRYMLLFPVFKLYKNGDKLFSDDSPHPGLRKRSRLRVSCSRQSQPSEYLAQSISRAPLDLSPKTLGQNHRKSLWSRLIISSNWIWEVRRHPLASESKWFQYWFQFTQYIFQTQSRIHAPAPIFVRFT